MEARAVRKHIRSAPRKMRRVVNTLRGKSVAEALNVLQFMPHRATEDIQRTIRDALYNLIDQEEVRPDEGDLVIREIRVDEGPMFKRYRAAARGRANPYRKRTSHLTVVIATREDELEEI